jgi:hypothetical protein
MSVIFVGTENIKSMFTQFVFTWLSCSIEQSKKFKYIMNGDDSRVDGHKKFKI